MRWPRLSAVGDPHLSYPPAIVMSRSDPIRRDALLAGTSLREYTLDRVVGHGGFGIVYQARHKELAVVAAIKEYLPIELAIREGTAVRPRSGSDRLDYEDGLRRFRDEARALMQFCNHPTIVTCREFFQENGTAYLVMEYEEGLPLAAVLATRESEGRPFEEADLLSVMVPLLEGLRDVHEAGLLHRDIKPSNILIRSRDESPVLIDFGTAKQLMAKQSKSMAPFTEGYAALEQVADAGELGPWTDLYGVGAVMWRMVAGGQRPWEPPHPVRVERRSHAAVANADDPLPPARLLGRNRFSRDVLDAIDACLRLRENERIQSCRDLLRTLQTARSVSLEIMPNQASRNLSAVNAQRPSRQRTHPKLWGFLSSKRIPLLFRLALGWPLARICGLPVSLRIICDLKSTDAQLVKVVSNAILNDPQGQFSLAKMYYSGSGITENHAQSTKWYRKAAKQGHLQAQHQLARLYYYNVGENKDAISAIQWWHMSATHGNLASQHALGNFYQSEGVRQDYSQSTMWYSKAAAQGHPVAQYELANHYSFGKGVISNDHRALKWYRRAANMGHKHSQYQLGYAYYHGRQVSENRTEAARWYRRAAEQGEELSQLMLGLQYFHGYGVEQSATMAAYWLKKAVDGLRIDEAYFGETLPDEIGECYFILGELYEIGKGVKRDEVAAYKWYQLSADRPFDDSDMDREELSLEDQLSSEDIEDLILESEYGYDEDHEDHEDQYYTHAKAVKRRDRVANILTKGQVNQARKMVLDHRTKPTYLDLWREEFAISKEEKERFPIQPDERVVPHSVPLFQSLELDPTWYNLPTRKRIQFLIRISKTPRFLRALLCWPLHRMIGLDTSMRLIRDLNSRDAGFSKKALAAVLGDASSQFQIGLMYAAGEAVMLNPWEASNWIRRSATQDHAGAQFFLGFLYYFGYGVVKDSDQATKWYRKAVRQGCTASHFVLCDVSCVGRSIEEDQEEATRWYKCIANRGHLPPHEPEFLPLEIGSVFPEATKWYQKIAVQRDPWTQYGFAAQCASSKGAEPNYRVAAKWYRLAAEQGHSEAQYQLGRLYDLGKGIKQDHLVAALWYQRAAEQGDELAQYRLGAMYCFGEGVEQNHSQAIRWFRKAGKEGDESAKACLIALQGGPSAQYSLAAQYDSAKMGYDEGEAIKWYELAATGGDLKSQVILGWWYYVGHYVKRNYAVAAKWYRRAAELGHPNAQYSIGRMYAIGEGVSRDDNVAFKWYGMAAEQGNAEAQSALGTSYQFGIGVEKDVVEATLWYRTSAEQGNMHAQYELGMLFFSEDGVTSDLEEAAIWFRKAAIQGEDRAQYMLGMMYCYGQGVKRSYSEAVPWLKKSAEQGDSISQYILGTLYQKGRGVKPDCIEAARWYTCSASHDISEAQYALGKMHECGNGVIQDYMVAYIWYSLAASGELTDCPEWGDSANSIAGPDFSLVNAADGRDRVDTLMSSTERRRAHELMKSRQKTIESDRVSTEDLLARLDECKD